jgi:hypothetical protein
MNRKVFWHLILTLALLWGVHIRLMFRIQVSYWLMLLYLLLHLPRFWIQQKEAHSLFLHFSRLTFLYVMATEISWLWHKNSIGISRICDATHELWNICIKLAITWRLDRRLRLFISLPCFIYRCVLRYGIVLLNSFTELLGFLSGFWSQWSSCLLTSSSAAAFSNINPKTKVDRVNSTHNYPLPAY